MSDERVETEAAAVFSPRERAQLVAKALGEAARQARLSKRRRLGRATRSHRGRSVERIFKIIKVATFVGIVVGPSLAVAVYYGFVASDQYMSEARFTVRGGLPMKLEGIGTLTGAPSVLIMQDTQVIMNYIQSRAMVEHLGQAVALRERVSAPSLDFHTRMDPDASIETFVRYWKSMIDVSVLMPSGIVSFTVKAGSPDAAMRIADAALDASERLVNQMNDAMIADTLAVAESARLRAEKALAATRANLERVRNEEGTLSAETSADALNGLITSVRGDLAKLRQDYDAQRRYLSEDTPTIRNLQARIGAADTEVLKLQANLTQGVEAADGKTLAGSMSKLGYVRLENQAAEKTYAAALALLERARLAAETKLMYINAFVRPLPPQQAKYPRRALNTGLFCAAALALWGSLIGLLGVVRTKLGWT